MRGWQVDKCQENMEILGDNRCWSERKIVVTLWERTVNGMKTTKKKRGAQKYTSSRSKITLRFGSLPDCSKWQWLEVIVVERWGMERKLFTARPATHLCCVHTRQPSIIVCDSVNRNIGSGNSTLQNLITTVAIFILPFAPSKEKKENNWLDGDL